ncbi:MAG: hypothetical protein ACK578_24110 [Pirellula sp.]|jgi:hypothetical protein
MAVRLPVVLCQHERRNGKQAEHEEQWITKLLFEERLDATLVADLAQIQLESTDHLCLEGLRGDFVLVSWHSKELVAEQLARLGFLALQIVPIDGSAKLAITNAKAPTSKKVYFLSFDLGRTVEDGLSRLKELLSSRSTPVFQLNSSLSKDRPRVGPPMDMKTLPVIDAPKASNTQTASPPGSKTPVVANVRFDARRSSTETAVDISEENDFPHIDSLMSDLDKFDA